jgi:2-succinyl-5-enolpyruvyl-6-hydroxy-3-cyclohexene-1-carboxylate synthase
MTNGKNNLQISSIFVRGLALAGVSDVVISPGSRSTPLTLAFHSHKEIALHMLTDERSAAFFALGIAKNLKKPVALVCTSGSAVANYFPAIIEASITHIPLIVISADRPSRLRFSGANQAIDQIKIYGDYAKWFHNIEFLEKEISLPTAKYIWSTAFQAVSKAFGSNAGPVHLNFSFDKPFHPNTKINKKDFISPFDDELRAIELFEPNNSPSKELLDLAKKHMVENRKGIIVCGPNHYGEDFPNSVIALSERIGFPIFTDSLSGIRFGKKHPMVLGAQETFLNKSISDVEIILHFGKMSVGKNLLALVNDQNASVQIHIDDCDEWANEGFQTTINAKCNPIDFCDNLVENLSSISLDDNQLWVAELLALEKSTWKLISNVIIEKNTEFSYVMQMMENLPEGANLFVANSNSIRHVDQFARPMPKKVNVFANRGASGIDGNLSTALGISVSSSVPTVLLIGDLALMHDINALFNVQKMNVNMKIIVMNNQGGGIFERLSISKQSDIFQELFITPHSFTFEGIEAMFNIPIQVANNTKEFEKIFVSNLETDGPAMIEINTNTKDVEFERQKIITNFKNQSNSSV